MLTGDLPDRFQTPSQMGRTTALDPDDLGTIVGRDLIVSESAPSGTYPDGTIWLQLEPA